MKCKCGCGRKVKPGNTYINGHNKGWKGHNWDLCKKCGKVHKPYWLGKIGPTLGKHWKLTGQALKNHKPNLGKHWKLTGQALKNHNEAARKPERNKNLSNSLTGKHFKRTGQALKNVQEANRKPEKIKKITEKNKGQKRTGQALKNIQEANIKKWQNPDYAKKVIKAWHKKPNGFEIDVKTLLDIIVSNQYIYTGNKSRVDFKHKKNKLKIILAHGIYWHLWKKQIDRNDYTLTKKAIEKEDIKKYRKLGYKDILIIWEDDFYYKINKVVSKIQKFNGDLK